MAMENSTSCGKGHYGLLVDHTGGIPLKSSNRVLSRPGSQREETYRIAKLLPGYYV